MTTNAETINAGVRGIEDIIRYTRVVTFDDNAARTGILTYASILLMVVDIVLWEGYSVAFSLTQM